MKTESPIPAQVRSWLDARLSDAADRLADLWRGGAAGDLILRGMQNHAVALGPPEDPQAMAVLDALLDLRPILGDRLLDLLPAVTRHLGRLPARRLHPEWCEQAPLS